MDEIHDQLHAIYQRKLKQNQRRAKAGKPPMHPGLKAPSEVIASPASDPETACSFQEWKDAGYFVKKGQKSDMQDALGVPQFTLDQVRKASLTRRRGRWRK